MNKKVCFFVGSVKYSGGTERVSSIIANFIKNYGYDVLFITLDGSISPFFELNVKIKPLDINRNKFSYIKQVRNIIIDNNIDVFIDVDTMLSMYSVPALIGLKVQHISWEHFNFKCNFDLKSRYISRHIARIFCDNIVVLTERDHLLWQKKSFGKSNIVTISNPLLSSNKVEAKKLTSKIMLAVGRLTKQKGFDLLLESWSKAETKDWNLHIVGDGEELNLLQTQAETLGISETVKFYPATKNINYYYDSSAFLCMSSRFEGFGMVILEAMSRGLPIVSFDCDAGPSDMVFNGYNGYLVSPESVSELSIAIENMINIDSDDYTYMSENSLEKSSLFNIDIIGKKWVELIK